DYGQRHAAAFHPHHSEPLMDDLFRAVVVLIVGNILVTPFILSVGALFPRRVARTRALAESMPGRSLVIGVINVLFLGGLAVALSALADSVGNELPRLPAVLIIALVIIGLTFGLTAVAQLIGERLRPNDDTLRQSIWGALTLSLGSALPFIGWFALLPYAGCLGLGAFILSFFVREHIGQGSRGAGEQG
ncbi:MAG: hypothetical protein ACT4QE_24195, partial [Anaerolineales bacterium]